MKINHSIKWLIKMLKVCCIGTRDGFSASAFHSRCDGKANTVTIIKNDINHVFGGYISVAWHNSNEYKSDSEHNDIQYKSDSNAYLFSLRRDNSSHSEKYLLKYPEYAIYGNSRVGLKLNTQFPHSQHLYFQITIL